MQICFLGGVAGSDEDTLEKYFYVLCKKLKVADKSLAVNRIYNDDFEQISTEILYKVANKMDFLMIEEIPMDGAKYNRNKNIEKHRTDISYNIGFVDNVSRSFVSKLSGMDVLKLVNAFNTRIYGIVLSNLGCGNTMLDKKATEIKSYFSNECILNITDYKTKVKIENRFNFIKKQEQP